ncbi:MAG: hypothetical protein R3E12_10935, partial [Candidatus Eisenbacteria bacterium]
MSVPTHRRGTPPNRTSIVAECDVSATSNPKRIRRFRIHRHRLRASCGLLLAVFACGMGIGTGYADTVDWSQAASFIGAIAPQAPVFDILLSRDGSVVYAGAIDRLLVFSAETGQQLGVLGGIAAFSLDYAGGAGDDTECLVVSDPSQQKLLRVDVSDPSNPVIVGSDNLPGFQTLVRSDSNPAGAGGLIGSTTGTDLSAFAGSDCGTPATLNGGASGSFNTLDIWSEPAPVTGTGLLMVDGGPNGLDVRDDWGNFLGGVTGAPVEAASFLTVDRVAYATPTQIKLADVSDPVNPTDVGWTDVAGVTALERSTGDRLWA